MINPKFQIVLLSAVFAIADLLSKWAVIAYMPKQVNITDWFALSYSENTGIAWSIQIPPVALIPLNIALLGFLTYYALKNFNLKLKISILSLALILGGASGNLIERIVIGHVTDFISIGIWPVFNLADIFVSLGIFLLAVFYVKIKRT